MNSNGGPRVGIADGRPPAMSRRRYDEILDQLDIPRPFDLDAFTAQVEALRQRRLVLIAVSAGTGLTCGVWLADRDTDYVPYERDPSPARDLRAKLHQLAHLLCGHDARAPLSPQFLVRALPDLAPHAIARVLGPTPAGAQRTDVGRELDVEALVALVCEIAELPA